ncbi:hypothetical protein PMAYCL1PPCAC_27990, partial [Pristionchus mayeri]
YPRVGLGSGGRRRVRCGLLVLAVRLGSLDRAGSSRRGRTGSGCGGGIAVPVCKMLHGDLLAHFEVEEDGDGIDGDGEATEDDPDPQLPSLMVQLSQEDIGRFRLFEIALCLHHFVQQIEAVAGERENADVTDQHEAEEEVDQERVPLEQRDDAQSADGKAEDGFDNAGNHINSERAGERKHKLENDNDDRENEGDPHIHGAKDNHHCVVEKSEVATSREKEERRE